MVGMDGDGHRDPQFVAERVHGSGNVPVVNGTIGVGTPLGFGNLYNQGGIGALGRFECSTYDKTASAVGCHGNGIPFGQQSAVNKFAADN